MTLVTWTPYAYGSRDAEALADPFAGFASTGTVVGADPLATRDGDTSYIELTGSDQVVTFALAPDKAVPPIETLVEAWWAYDIRITATPTFGADMTVWMDGPEIRGTYGDENAPVRPADWTLVEWFHITPAYSGDAVDYVTAFLDQPEAYFGARGPGGGTVRVTWLRAYALFDDGDAPLRLYQRGDRLGAGSNRLFGVNTRQGSTRVFGAL